MNDEEDHSNQTVVVLGATGVVGRHLIGWLAKKEPSWIVKAITRDASKVESSPHDDFPELKLPTVQLLQGDPLEKETLSTVITKEVNIVFQCIMRLHPPRNKKYNGEHWPKLIDNLLEICKNRSSFTRNSGKNGSNKNPQLQIVFAENLYAYDVIPKAAPRRLDRDPPPSLGPETETGLDPSIAPRVTPGLNSHAAIRSVVVSKINQHMILYPQTVTVVFVSDYFAPNVIERAYLGNTFCQRICEGKRPLAIKGTALVIHDFCYLPDFIRALHRVSYDLEAYDKLWVCPHSIQNKTLSEIATDMDKILRLLDDSSFTDNNNSKNDNNPKQPQRPTLPEKFQGVRVIPGLMVRTLTPFNAYLAEVMERIQIWRRKYHINDQPFLSNFPDVQATPYEDAIREYVVFYMERVRQQQAAAAAAASQNNNKQQQQQGQISLDND